MSFVSFHAEREERVQPVECFAAPEPGRWHHGSAESSAFARSEKLRTSDSRSEGGCGSLKTTAAPAEDRAEKLMTSNAPIRQDLVDSVRRCIDRGQYDTDEKLDVAIEFLMRRLCKS
jgi:hypothetical protein